MNVEARPIPARISGSSCTPGCGDGLGSVQVQMDPALTIGHAKVFAVYGTGGIGQRALGSALDTARTALPVTRPTRGLPPRPGPGRSTDSETRILLRRLRIILGFTRHRLGHRNSLSCGFCRLCSTKVLST